MTKKNPYSVIKHQYITEKAMMLGNLKSSESNVSVRRCKSPKYMFVVDDSANKKEIASAIEEIYHDRGVKVLSVNTVNVEGKAKRFRGRPGFKSSYKKAVVTLREGDSLDNV